MVHAVDILQSVQHRLEPGEHKSNRNVSFHSHQIVNVLHISHDGKLYGAQGTRVGVLHDNDLVPFVNERVDVFDDVWVRQRREYDVLQGRRTRDWTSFSSRSLSSADTCDIGRWYTFRTT